MRVLDNGSDWDVDGDLVKISAAPVHEDSLEIPNQFTNPGIWHPEGGDYEIRTHWRYNSEANAADPMYQQLLDLGAATHRAPSIRSLKVKGIGGIKILDAESN